MKKKTRRYVFVHYTIDDKTDDEFFNRKIWNSNIDYYRPICDMILIASRLSSI